MKKVRIVYAVIMSCALMLALGCANTPATTTNNSPGLVITPVVAPLDSNTQFVIIGTDYEPGRVIKIMLVDPQTGVLINVATQMNPNPVTDENGSWVTVWTLGRYASRGVFNEGLYRLWVTYETEDSIASTTVGLVDTSKPREEWPSWGQALIAE